MLKQIANRALAEVLSTVNRREWSRQSYRRRNERPIEYRFVFEHLNRTSPREVLDVGTGTTALPSLMRSCGFVVTAIDNIRDYWVGGMYNRHFHVLDDDIRRPRLARQFDVITCVSVLEHIKESRDAVRGMFSLLKPGGRLLITCPYNEKEYVANAYALPDAGYGRDAPYVCQTHLRQFRNRTAAILHG